MTGWGAVTAGYGVALAVWLLLAVWAVRSGRSRP